MNAKLNMEVKLSEMQAQVKNGTKQARNLARKAILVHAGLLGMAYDATKSLLKNSMKWVDEAEQRGETIVQDVGERVDMLRHQANATVMDWSGRVEQRVQVAATKLNEDAKAVQRSVEETMEQFAGRDENQRVESLAIEITEVAFVEPGQTEPLAGYHEMTAKDVIQQLANLGPDVLTVVRAYEVAHNNRVTVLDAIDEQLAKAEPVAA